VEIEVSIRKQLRDFELQVDFTAKDEVFALLGASGCGKSMTLKCIAGIEIPDQGYIRLGKRVLFDSEQRICLTPQQRHIGYLFQNYALFPNMTVLGNLQFAARGTFAESRCRIQDNIRRFALQGLEGAYPAALSGGQQQRVAFARILVSEADILLLDEPFSALDSYLKWQLEQELMHVLGEYGGSALFVSHDRGEVYRLCDRAAVINRGHIEAIDSKQALFANPQTLAGALLTGCKNVSAARKIDKEHFSADEWGILLTGTVGQPIPDHLRYVGIRAHFFVRASGPGENTFAADIVEVIEDTFSFLVMWRPSGGDGCSRLLRWEVDKETWRQVNGSKIYLCLPADKIMYMQK